MRPLQIDQQVFHSGCNKLRGFNEVEKTYTNLSQNINQSIQDKIKSSFDVNEVGSDINNNIHKHFYAGIVKKHHVFITIITDSNNSNQLVMRFNCDDILLCSTIQDSFSKILLQLS